MFVRIGILTHEQQPGQEFHGTERLYEEIINAGYEPVVIDYLNSVVAVSGGKPALLSSNESQKQLEQITVDVIIPNFDREVEAGLLAMQALTTQGAISLQAPEAIRNTENKMSTHLILAQAGIPTPDSVMQTVSDSRPLSDAEAKLVEDDPSQPIIVKELDSSRGEGVHRARNSAEALRMSYDFTQASRHHFAQKYLRPENDLMISDRRYFVVGEAVIASMVRHLDPEDVRQGEFRTGISSGGIGLPQIAPPGEIELALATCRALNISYAGVDIEDDNVLDVNPWPGYAIERITGTNVAAAVVEYAAQLPG